MNSNCDIDTTTIIWYESTSTIYAFFRSPRWEFCYHTTLSQPRWHHQWKERTALPTQKFMVFLQWFLWHPWRYQMNNKSPSLFLAPSKGHIWCNCYKEIRFVSLTLQTNLENCFNWKILLLHVGVFQKQTNKKDRMKDKIIRLQLKQKAFMLSLQSPWKLWLSRSDYNDRRWISWPSNLGNYSLQWL